ncbi:hypothetical protein JDW21_11275 [Bacillus subtilis]|nr:hypothetical protein [Bacillus subtilis]MBF8215138.1 hypothetical protein [Bacillus subtilis]MBL5985167.1 hypothetical protein [Bacillus subtilis]MBT2223071.1 hypothetical protein [Bacillus subtilis]MBU8625032.1 hypothetical protein [Bacillus subtilis]MCA4144904.1 hypothetical protein [Bacillus subtilis]
MLLELVNIIGVWERVGLTPANGLAKEGGASFISVLVFFCVKKLRGD